MCEEGNVQKMSEHGHENKEENHKMVITLVTMTNIFLIVISI